MLKITRDQFLEFIKKPKDKANNVLTSETTRYLDYFDKYQNTGKKISWHWPAFLFNYLWFVYRRMYLHAFSIAVGFSLLDKVVKKIIKISNITGDLADLIVSFSNIAAIVILALYANYIYVCYAEDKISKGRKTSGVNLWALWIILFVSVLCIIGLITYFGFEETMKRL